MDGGFLVEVLRNAQRLGMVATAKRDHRVIMDSNLTSQNLLSSQNDVVFLLDANFCFLECSPAWDLFASDNGGRGISRAEILHKNIFDFIPDILRKFYEHKYWFAQQQGSSVEFDYDCSSPEKIRLFRMSIRPLEANLLVVNRLTLEEECEISPPLKPEERQQYLSPGGFLTMCANCRKVRRQDAQAMWVWVPEFLNEAGLPVTHGLCPRCLTLLYGDA